MKLEHRYQIGHYRVLGIITEAEADALILRDSGMSTRTIALSLGISRSAARERLRNAIRKIAQQEAR